MEKKRNMLETKTEINIDLIPSFLLESGISALINTTAVVGSTRKGGTQLVLDGVAKRVMIPDGGGLQHIRAGGARFFLDRLVDTADVLKGDLTAPQLLSHPQFRDACLCEVDLETPLVVNTIMRRIVGIDCGRLPVFYGSTAGINFAEVMETALCAKEAQTIGIDAEVVFDFESAQSRESDLIFRESVAALPSRLREKVVNFSTAFSGGLIESRLEAVQNLLGKVGELPPIKFIEGLEIFRILGDRFTIGQLLVLARIAGRDPRLFTSHEVPFSASLLCDSLACERFKESSFIDLFKKPVSFSFDFGFKPAGFTYYARDAIIGKSDGVVGFPIKLTDAANIYKIMLSTGSLFNPQKGNGAILFPITRMRIQMEPFGKPVDPTVLKILADDQPEAFVKLARAFQSAFRVLTPEEAIDAGTKDVKFLIKEYFNLEEDDR